MKRPQPDRLPTDSGTAKSVVPDVARAERGFFRLIGLLIAVSFQAQAAAPSLTSVFPAGGPQGGAVEITFSGKPEKGRIWIEGEGVSFTEPDAKGKATAEIAADAAPGIRLVRLVNDEGVSEARRFVIGTLPEISEIEPNDAALQGQLIESLPICINGRLDKGDDVDGFSFELKKGQEIYVHVLAYTLGSLIDPHAHILDASGHRILTASDARNLDPEFAFTAPETGRYTLQIAGFVHPPASNVSFTGGSAVVYRVLIHTGPVVTRLFPPAVQSGEKNELELRGHGLPKDKSLFKVDAAASTGHSVLRLFPPDAPLPIEVVVGPGPITLEKEPNDKPEQATPIPALPATAAGVIRAGDDEDRFVFAVKKGQKLRAEVWSQRLGLPLDAVLRVEDAEGKVLTSNEDQRDTGDPLVNWTAAAEGEHQVIVSDQFHRGGPRHEYAVRIGELTPNFEATLADAKPIKIEPGKSATLKVTVKLIDGWKQPLVLRAIGLPETISAPEVTVPEKGGEVTLTLKAAKESKPSTHPFTLAIAAPESQEPLLHPIRHDLRSDTRRGTSLSDHGETLLLTIGK